MSDFTYKFLSNIIGYMQIFICAAMCYMPVTGKLKLSVKNLLLIAVPVLSFIVIVGSLLSTCFGITQNTVVLPVSVILLAVYYRTLDADFFQCLFIFMYVTSLTCYPYHYALCIDAMTNPGGSYELFPLWVELVLELFLLIIAAVFFFARKQIAAFTENFKKVPMKKIFWVVPFFYAAALIFIIPFDYDTIHTRRMIYIYPTAVTALFISEITIVYLFRRVTSEITHNEKLERENQMLEFQSKRYESLRDHIRETARIRHDFRQQLRTISSFAENDKYDELKNYLAEYSESISGTEWSPFCQNSAVDAIVGYYSSMAEQQGIKTDWHIELPKELPIMESVFCGMLGNLIENAINACEAITEGEKIIHLSAQISNNKMLVVIIENSYNGIIKTDKNGSILSSKHKGRGIGLSSVQTITEKYHGKMQVQYDDKTFRVNVLLKF